MRPNLDEYFLRIAAVVAVRGTCARRQVGCVLVDYSGDTLATGYNGPPSGWDHCTDTPCPGASAKSGESLDLCEAIHAEANALLRCADIRKIYTCYVTVSPCLACVKLLLNTPCQRIVFSTEYAHDTLAAERWFRSHRDWEHKHVNL